MSQFTRILPVAASTAFLLAACGHELKAPDLTKGETITGSGGTGGSTTGGTGGTGGGGTGGGGSGGTGGSAAMPGDMCGDRKQTLVINGHDMMPGYWLPDGVADQVDQAIASMPLPDKIAQMQGIAAPAPGTTPSWDDIERSYDVPVGSATPTLRGYRYRDAGRGLNLDAGQDNRPSDGKDYSTVFPTESVRAASWDLDLEWRVGKAMGDETAATKNNMLLAPCMNIIRHPYWGRTQETYSEDMYHTGRMASALTAGIQQHVVGCAKHFAANNVENLRKDQNAVMNEQTLREIYGRHFDMVINDGGIGCIMASYNKINGTKATQNKHLLTEVLREDFKYKGVVLSDWWAMPGDNAAFNETDTPTLQNTAAEAVLAGLDIEVPWTIYYSHIAGGLDLGLIQQSHVDRSARRVLEQKYRFNTWNPNGPWGINNPVTKFPNAAAAGTASIDEPDHRALTEETLIKSAVLLANGPKDGSMPMLPWADKANIAVVGINYAYKLETGTCPNLTPGKMGCTHQFGFDANLGDRGSSRVNGDPATTISVFEGFEMMKTAGLHGVASVTNGVDATPVDTADVAVVVVGTTPGDEGEEYAIPTGGDRTSLSFPGAGAQEALVTAVLDKMKPTVIIVESGSIMSLPWLDHPNKQQATIWAGYPGHNGGAALAKLVFGDFNFSGKMPMAWPTQAQLDLQKFEDDPNNYITNMGYFFGYRFYDDLQAKGMFNTADLVFPFGHGLSYTKFEYSGLEVPCGAVSKGAVVDVNFKIKNTGAVAGQEVAMLFVAPPPNGKAGDDVGDRPVKELKGFVKTPLLMPMEEYSATIQMRVQDLRRWKPAGMNPNATTGEWVIDNGDYTLMVGKNAADADKNNPMVLSKTVTIQ
jgi:beta-glucosidase